MSLGGFGSQSFGATAFGLGDPSLAPAGGGSVLHEKATGLSTGSRLISPQTRDYVIDATGRTLGMSDVQQLVLLAVTTVKRSSAMTSLGHDLSSIAVIDDDIERTVQTLLEEALLHLTSRGRVAILSIAVVRRRPGAIDIRLRWRDLTAQRDFTTEI